MGGFIGTKEHRLEKERAAVETLIRAEEEAIRDYRHRIAEIDAELAVPDLEPWQPKEGEEYWYIADDGCLHGRDWEGDNVSCKWRRRAYNVFRPKEAVHIAAAYERAMRKLRHLASRLNPVGWVPNGEEYSIVSVGRVWSVQNASPYVGAGTPQFHTREAGQTALDTMTADELAALRRQPTPCGVTT